MLPEGAHAIDVAMGEVIARNRRRCGLTACQLAEFVSTTTAQIKRYEAGTNKVSISRLLEFAEAFEIAPSYLVAQMVVTVSAHHCRSEKHSSNAELLASRQGQALVDTVAYVRTNGPNSMIDDIQSLANHYANACLDLERKELL